MRNLTKDDFTLEEDGRPQTIRYFSKESGLPLTLGLLVDTSISQSAVPRRRTHRQSIASSARCSARIRIGRSSFTSIAK